MAKKKYPDKCSNCGTTKTKTFWDLDDGSVLCDKCHKNQAEYTVCDKCKTKVNKKSILQSVGFYGQKYFCQSCYLSKAENLKVQGWSLIILGIISLPFALFYFGMIGGIISGAFVGIGIRSIANASTMQTKVIISKK
ncbi:hypothetical protein J4434_06660 [Candidatus Woesearchaeota archaeon]|nr:hypothetical protein [Candidatus Woesearchaeota archaeon]